MIRVEIYRGSGGRIERFSVDGHAQYGDPGKDIVCAGVSAVTVGTVNAVEALAGLTLKSRMKNGFLRVDIPAELGDELSSKVQLLLESMIVMIQTIEQSYGAYIAMHEHSKARR